MLIQNCLFLVGSTSADCVVTPDSIDKTVLTNNKLVLSLNEIVLCEILITNYCGMPH